MDIAASCTCLVGIFFALASMAAQASAAPNAKSASDFVCGPRCVDYILRQYGRTTELIELIRAVQWPDIERGATMKSLEACLQQRGVHTFAMRLSPSARLQWPQPVLVHLHHDQSPEEHFVVWLPSSSRALVHYWDGLLGRKIVSSDEFARMRSGAVILTSDRPINESQIVVYDLGGQGPRLKTISVFGLLLLVTVWRLRSRSKRKSMTA